MVSVWKIILSIYETIRLNVSFISKRVSQWENRIFIYIKVYPHTNIMFYVWNLNYVTSTLLVKNYVQQVSSFTLLASPNSLKSCLAHFTLFRLNCTVTINLWLSSPLRSHGEMARSCIPAVIIIWSPVQGRVGVTY